MFIIPYFFNTRFLSRTFKQLLWLLNCQNYELLDFGIVSFETNPTDLIIFKMELDKDYNPFLPVMVAEVGVVNDFRSSSNLMDISGIVITYFGQDTPVTKFLNIQGIN